jgi:hypothetical protein
MIVQEHDKFTFAVDTARCWGDKDLVKYRIHNEKAQKIHKVGKDMVFISGMTECIEQCIGDIHLFINKKNHVNTELLKQYLKKEFSPEKSKYKGTGLNDIGVTVFSVINNESIIHCFEQTNNFENIKYVVKPNEIKLLVTGFDSEKIYNYAFKYIRGLRNVADYRSPDTFIHVYQNNYSEGVGGYIQVYSMDSDGCNMIIEHRLKEEGLRYVTYVSNSNKLTTQEKDLSFTSNITAGTMIGGTISGTDISGVNITGGTISGSTINGVTVNGSVINSSSTYGSLKIEGAYIRGRNASGDIKLDIDVGGNILCGNVQCSTVNGKEPITRGNIGEQSVAYASEAGSSFISDISVKLYKSNLTQNAYISANDNFIPSSNQMYIGSSANPWAGGYGVSGWVTTSDERLKEDIRDIDERYLQLAKKIIPKLFKMKQGTSGRFHVGFIAQEVEAAMIECGISSTEFAGLVKAPVYSEHLKDENGNELNEYDTTSEVVDYTYHLRYEEFIPLIFLWMRSIDNQAATSHDL